MEVLSIKGTSETPEVLMDPQSGTFKILGRSLPEDVKDFYSPLIKWLEAYAATPNSKTVLVVKMDYFNTASSKMLLEIFEILKDIHDKGNDVCIEWNYLEDDEDMEDAGQDYSEIVEVPFKFVSYQSID